MLDLLVILGVFACGILVGAMVENHLLVMKFNKLLNDLNFKAKTNGIGFTEKDGK
jgi:hypothetical protein